MPKKEPFEQTYQAMEDERLLRMLALEAYREEQADMAAFSDSPAWVPPSPEQEARFQAFIEAKRKKAGRTLKAPRFFTRMPRALRAVTVLGVIVFILSCSTTAAYAARKSLISFMTADYPMFTHFWRDDGGEEPGRPQGWNSEIYPIWLPEGFILTGITDGATGQFARYAYNERSFYIHVAYDVKEFLLNTDGMKKSVYTLNGEDVSIYSTPDHTHSGFAFLHNDYTITIFGAITPEDIINIVEHLHGMN